MPNPINVPPKVPRRPRGLYTVSVHSGGRVTIPVDIRNYFNMQPGKKVQFIVRGNTIYLKKV